VTGQASVVIEVIGEGRADIGATTLGERPHQPAPPDEGVVPILLQKLCGKPAAMRIRRRAFSALQGKTRAQKVQFSKRQALYNGSAGMVFVLDSEGDLKRRRSELIDGRGREHPDYPAAIGVAHPCIETWLLVDGPAIRRALELPAAPPLPDNPEELPAPSADGRYNPKSVLRDIAGCRKGELGSREKDEIAKAMNDLALLRSACPLGFAPFADEVEQHILPLF
jgi:hypothetical protein